MNRFFVDKEQIIEDKIYITNKEDIKHMSKVLRMSLGDFIEISDGEKFEYIGKIESISPDKVTCLIQDKQSFGAEPITRVTLFQGVPKQGKMESIIQKCVELGIYEIVPVFMSRSVVLGKEESKLQGKTERWQKISDEAVKQCKRGIKPQILKAVDFKGMIKILSHEFQGSEEKLILFPYENEENYNIKQALKAFKVKIYESDKGQGEKNAAENNPHVAIIIGPEGGFSQEEATALRNLGAECVTLGKTTLRTETAAPAALAMVMYELELS